VSACPDVAAWATAAHRNRSEAASDFMADILSGGARDRRRNEAF